MSALIKGYSKVKDMRTMAGMCWAVITRLGSEVFIDYVWTHDNPADASSHLEEHECDFLVEAPLVV